MATAYLFHYLDWDLDSKQERLSNRTYFCDMHNSNVKKLYEKFCHEFGCDHSEPFDYNVFAFFDDNQNTDFCKKEPDSHISFLCNSLVICLKQPIGMCRMIEIDESTNALIHSDMEFEYTSQTHEFIAKNGSASISNYNIQSIKDCYNNICEISDNKNIKNKIIFAISYYYRSWTAHYLEETCVNLAIVLETLFNPNTKNELSHQISYNFACFLGKTPNQKEELYDFCKKFYSLRSKIVHGSVPNQNKLVDIIPLMFNYCSDALREILSSKELISIFQNCKTKSEYFKKKLFFNKD